MIYTFSSGFSTPGIFVATDATGSYNGATDAFFNDGQTLSIAVDGVTSSSETC